MVEAKRYFFFLSVNELILKQKQKEASIMNHLGQKVINYVRELFVIARILVFIVERRCWTLGLFNAGTKFIWFDLLAMALRFYENICLQMSTLP